MLLVRARWMPKFQLVTYGVRRLRSTAKIVHGFVGRPLKTPGAAVPSPHTGVTLVGKMEVVAELFCQPLLRRFLAGPPLKTKAWRSMVPVPGVATLFTTSVAAVGTEGAPSKLPRAMNDCMAICS